MVKKKNNSGFTLIEVIAVIGVLAVTSAILILNNRLNELQLSLSKDSALIASTVSRAKSLALQNSAGIGGYGARFESEDVDKDSFYIFKDKDIDGYSVGEDKLEKMNLSSGGIFYNPTGAWPFITDVVFFSSDANVKLFDSQNGELKNPDNSLASAGLVILQTDTTPSSFYTLKITITGQVSSKSGLYISPADFDAGKKSVMNDDGTIGDAPPGDIDDPDPDLDIIIPPYKDEPPDLNCIANCSGKCGGPNGCNGVCPNTCLNDYTCSSSFNSCIYTGGGGGECEFPENTCINTNSAGVPCQTCVAPNVCTPANGTYNCVILSSAKDITSFSILGVYGDIVGNNISLTLPYGTNISALVATFITTGITVEIGSVLQVSEETPNNFSISNPKTYIVTAANDSTKNYTVTVSVASIDAKDITSFKILGVYGDIVGTNISLTLPYGTSKLSLTPTIQITGQSVSPVSGVSQDFTGPKTYTVYDANTPPGTKNYTVTVSVASIDAKDITSFKILGVYGDIVGTNISLTLPYGTSKLSLTPTIQITGQSVSPVSGVSQDFTGPKTYTVYDANTPPGTKNYTVIVNILACPAGQTKPYSVCNSSNGVCESVDACGATTCTVNSCGIEEPLIIDSIFPPTTTND